MIIQFSCSILVLLFSVLWEKTLKTNLTKNIFLSNVITGGAFDGVIDDNESPFGYKKGEGIDAGKGEVDWICDRDRERTDTIFDTLNPIDGKISGAGRTFIITIY